MAAAAGEVGEEGGVEGAALGFCFCGGEVCAGGVGGAGAEGGEAG